MGFQKRPAIIATITFLILVITSGLAFADDKTDKFSGSAALAQSPVYCSGLHDIGQLVFGITNYGTFGRPPFRDCFTNQKVPMAEFPKKSNTVHLYRAGLWVGAVVGRDTLVSTAIESNISSREFNPDVPPFGDIIYRSSADPSQPGYDKAISEQDYISVYTDTFITDVPNIGFDAIDLRRHKPLGIEITQSSYGWSYDYTEDFVLVNYHVKNIGDNFLKDLYVGLYMDADVHDASTPLQVNPTPDLPVKPPTMGIDDLTGFVGNYGRDENGCNIVYPLNLAWTADNDGDSRGGIWFAPNVIGVRYLPAPGEFENVSYNWWVFNVNPNYDFGPQHRNNYRFLGNGYGTPIGDRNKYHLLRNSEQDYDQAWTASISPFNEVWVQPDPRRARLWSGANDNQWLLSAGPYDLQPGSEVDFPIGYVGGQQFHTNPLAWKRQLAASNDPEKYYSFLDFSDLLDNAVWAGWVYDNPGIDTDGDGYAGEFEVCILDSQFVDTIWVPSVAETTFYQGDGEPDWRGAAPPPAPYVWITPAVGGLHVRFNGERSETTKDIFSGIVDFEGYNVYIGRDAREQSFSLVATYDRENYRKFIYKADLKPQAGYIMEAGAPYKLDELRCLYGRYPDQCGDSAFDPLRYTPNNPFVHPFFPDSIFYFARHSSNASIFGVTTPIKKTYPNQPPPSVPPVSGDYTADNRLKFYEYEFDIGNLLPSVGYYMNVTAFDFGAPETGLEPLETSVVLGAIDAYAAGSAEELSGEFREVYVYPNPYRIDQNYRDRGFEGLTDDFLPDDKVRGIHFANLPPQCTIRIFSIDGDLIRELVHDIPADDPTSAHARWDLITRNRQIVVSGLYYWSIEFPDGSTQIGKLAILF